MSNQNNMTIYRLPLEVRLQIWSQLPLLSLLNLRFLSKDLFCDVDALFCSRAFAIDLLERLHTRVTVEHKETLEKYLKSANPGTCDEHIHTMFVLIHLLKSIGHMKLMLEGLEHAATHAGQTCMRSETDSRTMVRELLRRCESAARQCNQGKGTLWSDDLCKMLYPKVREYCFLDT